MRVKKILSLGLAAASSLCLFAGCGAAATDAAGSAAAGEHEAITMQSPFRNVTPFIELVAQKYPEINLEVLPYSGANMSAYLSAELHAGDMPDIYITTTYLPGQEDLSDRLMDLSGYDFTGNYTDASLRDVVDGNAIYLLPTYYTCLGITYNKTLLEQNGWELPTTFAELEELAPKVKAAGYNLAVDQIALPGYGFQYLCNILDTDFLNTINGRKWQQDYLNGTATVKGSNQMMEALDVLEQWRDLGMLNGTGDWGDDNVTKDVMAEGNTLFMLGSTNSFKEGDSDCEFGMMPYLSQDGSQNAIILNVSRYVGLNKHLEDAGNEQKLQDALHVMEVLSTVEGLSALNQGFEKTSLLPLKDYQIPEDSYYKQIEADLNSGMTAPFIYAGWDNLIVPIGEVVVNYIKGNATIDDVVNAIDDNQHLVKDNTSAAYTTVTEKLETEDCAKLVGICFSQASNADLALISINQWHPATGEGADLNTDGVSGELFALPVTDQEITSILPTGWRGDIETVTLTGKRIKELAESGYEYEGYAYPYVLVTPESLTINDDTTYTVAICGVSDEVAQEGNLTHTGILGLKAARDYLSKFKTLTKADLRWK